MIQFPSPAQVEQDWAAYQAEMAARRANPLPPPPRDQDERPAPPVAQVYCPTCGKVFDFATKGMSQMQRTLHIKRAHPDREAY